MVRETWHSRNLSHHISINTGGREREKETDRERRTDGQKEGRMEGRREGERGRKRRGGWKWGKAINPQIHTSPRHTSSIQVLPLKSSIISPTNATNWGPSTQLPDISHSNHHTLNSHFNVILIAFSNNRTFVWIKSLYLSSHLSQFEKK